MSDDATSSAVELTDGPVRRRELLAWALYDFANSGYTTVVLTTIYSAYFVAVVAAAADKHSPGMATLCGPCLWPQQIFACCSAGRWWVP